MVHDTHSEEQLQGELDDRKSLGTLFDETATTRASLEHRLKQAEKAFEAASQKAQDISIDRGVEVLLSERPRASVDPTYENLGAASRRNG